jgi:hypothetical protein
MTIHWGSLLTVFAVSMSSTIAVVVLVTLALLGLSARNTPPPASTQHPLFSPAAGTAVASACLTTTTAIVLFGLWTMIAR